jgi:hypothetical protein
MLDSTNIQAPSAAQGPCCSKSTVRFRFSEQRENPLTARCGISFCARGRRTRTAGLSCAIMTSCPMDSWQSSQPALCCFARACSLSHLANPSRRDRTCHRRNQHIGVNTDLKPRERIAVSVGAIRNGSSNYERYSSSHSKTHRAAMGFSFRSAGCANGPKNVGTKATPSTSRSTRQRRKKNPPGLIRWGWSMLSRHE